MHRQRNGLLKLEFETVMTMTKERENGMEGNRDCMQEEKRHETKRIGCGDQGKHASSTMMTVPS
jgi:hypothetical protein